ncbi:L-histidine N(alpha)-methyltransferase [Microlunatus sp. Gsoil 973]|uniref:L-histidine N(alpha)-methyltransferase n=1 Tax=Microlunatus sp. Gsoil 973 TaxID=2672569 RepID=UPI0012B4BDAB|nr:L-histidine N(alpha)-methyltransferase [Microlunatus sp. Gsoil 973]QGN33232.1 L-histidine N(alpha)-methyltransferase [Microlunatus sp. Gsoil 973]
MTLTRIDIDLPEHQLRETLVADAARGLLAAAKTCPPKYFYDQRGSELFEQICGLPEYYPTRIERRILTRWADEIVAAVPAFTSLVELGSGSSSKTPLLLDALYRQTPAVSYVPVDVSLHALVGAVGALRDAYRTLPIHGVVRDFEDPLHGLPDLGHRVVALLGGTIGNLDPRTRAGFLADVAAGLSTGEGLLLGVDLVKEPRRLVRAYDDAAGTTRLFNQNMLNVLNRLLDADFEPDRFDHVAVWNEEQSWIEMRLRAREAMKIRLGSLDALVGFEEGEEIRTEISTKFRRESLERELEAAGFGTRGWWVASEDEGCAGSAGDYAVVLGVRS